MLTLLALLALIHLVRLATLALAALLARRRQSPRRSTRSARLGAPSSAVAFAQPKPAWVPPELVRLKALMPAHGCRKVAVVFNHLHGARRRVTVSKSYVANVIRAHQHDILRVRQKLKHRRPRRLPRNLIWALDLTFLPSRQGAAPVLGILDHGSRACLALREMKTRTTVSILRVLLDAIERYGKPRSVRTDNEPILASRRLRICLAMLGIRHQRTAPFAPWQNGRVERLFRTFKEQILPWHRDRGAPSDLADDLRRFRLWYNHLRPHEHLDGLTPAMSWNRASQPRGKPIYLSDWDGRLSGFLFPT